MKLLIFSDSYPPEVRSAAILMQEFAEGMVELGHEVSVCTLMPKYNLAKEDIAKRSFISRDNENGVEVIRLDSLPVHNTQLWIRGIGELILPLIFLIGSFLVKKPDIIAIYSPPLTLGITAIILRYLRRIPFLLNVQDLFPQHIIDVGILKNRFIIDIYKGIEKTIYSIASKITVHSEGNRKYLLERRGVPAHKVEVINNWVNTEVSIGPKKNNFRDKWGIGDKFVLFFGGVMGFTQGLDLVIEVAERLKTYPNILFLLVGEGVEKPKLELLVRQKGLSNVMFKPFISPADYLYLLQEIDVGLVTLSPEVKTPVVPSKILGFMAASKPYIASVNKESDVISMTQQSRAGYYVIAGETDKMADLILKLYNNKKLTKEMGEYGRNYVKTYFSKDICLNNYNNLLELMIAQD